MKFKRIAALALTAVMSMSLMACGGKDKADSGKGEASKDKGGIVEITLPTYMAGENVGAVFFLPQIERFNKKYEGKYKINIEEVPQASYAEKIKQLAQQKELPVLIHAPGSGGIDRQWFSSVILANNMAYDLSSFAESHPDTAATWLEDSVDYCTVDGKLICKPTSVLKPVGLYYNSSMYSSDKDIKDMTMEEFIAGLGDNVFAFQTADNGWTSGLLLSAIIANQEGGAELLNKSADDKLYDYMDSSIVNSVADLQKLMQTNAASNSIGAAYADAANAFMSKNASFICNGSWMATEFDESGSDKWSNDFKGSDVEATYYPGNVALANPRMYGEFWVSNLATDKEKELAEAFLEFRDSKEEIEALLLAEGGVAPNITYTDEFVEKQKESPLLYSLAEKISDSTVYSDTILNVMPSSVADVEFGKLLPKLIDGTLTPEQFCQTLTEKAAEAK